MQPRCYFLELLDTGIGFNDPGIVYFNIFELNRQQTYRGSRFNVGWMRGTLVCQRSLSPTINTPSATVALQIFLYG